MIFFGNLCGYVIGVILMIVLKCYLFLKGLEILDLREFIEDKDFSFGKNCFCN